MRNRRNFPFFDWFGFDLWKWSYLRRLGIKSFWKLIFIIYQWFQWGKNSGIFWSKTRALFSYFLLMVVPLNFPKYHQASTTDVCLIAKCCNFFRNFRNWIFLKAVCRVMLTKSTYYFFRAFRADQTGVSFHLTIRIFHQYRVTLYRQQCFLS